MLLFKTTVCQAIHLLKLTIHKGKSKCVIFKMNSSEGLQNLQLGDDILAVPTSYKYLGHWVDFKLSDTEDIKLRINNFYSSFNSIIRDFKYVNKDTLLYLFNSYCLPDYGLSLWNSNSVFNSVIFKTFKTAYSKALKKICNVPVYASNHITAAECGQFLFEHLFSLTQARAYKRIKRSVHQIFLGCYQWMREGHCMTSIKNILE